MAAFAAPSPGQRSHREIQSQFRQHGVVHIRQLLDAASLAQVHALWQRRIAGNRSQGYLIPLQTGEGGQLLPETEPLIMDVDVATARTAADESAAGIFYGADADTGSYRPLAANRRVVDMLSCLFETAETAENGVGTPHVWSIGAQLFLKEGGSDLRTGWHADNSDIAVEGEDSCAIWIPLDPTGPHPLPSPLEFVKGSHRWGPFTSIYGHHVGTPIPDVQAARDEYDIISFPCEVGDVVCFHFGTLHGGGATTGAEQTRRAVALRYFGEDCRLSERSYQSIEETAAQWQQGFDTGALLDVVEAEREAEAEGAGGEGGLAPLLRRRSGRQSRAAL